MDKHKTKVKFIVYLNEVIALFPEERTGDYLASYCKLDQHSLASKNLIRCKRALPSQYKDLKKELNRIGYNLELV